MKTQSLMSTARAARFSGRSGTYLRTKARRGELQTYKHEGRYIYFLSEEIKALKDKKT